MPAHKDDLTADGLHVKAPEDKAETTTQTVGRPAERHDTDTPLQPTDPRVKWADAEDPDVPTDSAGNRDGHTNPGGHAATQLSDGYVLVDLVDEDIKANYEQLREQRGWSRETLADYIENLPGHNDNRALLAWVRGDSDDTSEAAKIRAAHTPNKPARATVMLFLVRQRPPRRPPSSV